jgi:hypothetical protein
MAITGTITTVSKIREFSDASSLWAFVLDGNPEEYTCRTFDAERGPVSGDRVLVFLMPERNHATQVVFDADLRVTQKALEKSE